MQKLAVLFVALTVAISVVRGQETKIIKFKPQPFSTRLQHYHIVSVVDDRKDTSSIGSVRSGLFSKKSVPLNFADGPATAIRGLLASSLTQDVQTAAVSMHIVQLEFAESTGGLRANGELRIALNFYIGNKQISEYRGGSNVSAGLDATRFVEELTRKTIDNILGQFDAWCANNKDQLAAMTRAPAVKMEVEMLRTPEDPNHIVFSPDRPLAISDFKGKPDDLSRAAAATSSGIFFKYSAEMLYSTTTVHVIVGAFFDQSRSWCHPNSGSQRTLVHEQQHFNITAIKACELVTVVRDFHFSPEKYQQELEELYRTKEKEVRDMQEQYDKATNHGLLPVVQQQWESRIRDSLQAQTCYHK